MKILKFIWLIIRAGATSIWWVFIGLLFIPALLCLAVALIMIIQGNILGYVSLIPYVFFFGVSLLRFKKSGEFRLLK